MIVTFTGPHKPKVSKGVIQERIEEALADLDLANVDGFISGAAPYVDSQAYFTAAYTKPDASHAVYVPMGRDGTVLWHNKKVVEAASEARHDIRYVLGGYLARDDAMVRDADVLLAFPNSMHEELRSGTWATIRRAWKHNVHVRYYPLDTPPGQLHGPVVRCT